MRSDPLTDGQKQLVIEHVGLAERLAERRSKTNPMVPLEDHRQEAYLGLIDAARSFDAARGVKFTTHAVRRIIGAMIDAERAAGVGPAVKIGRLARARGEAEIKVTSIEALNRENGRGSRDFIASEALFVDHGPPVGEAIERRDAIDAAMAGLPARERAIVRSYWLDGRTMKQAGMGAGVSESRVSQVMAAAIARLRSHTAIAHYAEVA